MCRSCAGTVLNHRKLMHGCLVLLPVSSLLLWCTGGLLYGVLLHGVDLCSGLSSFLLNPSTQQSSQIRVDLFPCPAAEISFALRQSATQTLFNMTRAVNTIIQGSVDRELVGWHRLWTEILTPGMCCRSVCPPSDGSV